MSGTLPSPSEPEVSLHRRRKQPGCAQHRDEGDNIASAAWSPGSIRLGDFPGASRLDLREEVKDWDSIQIFWDVGQGGREREHEL